MSRPQKPHLSFITTSFPPSPTKNPKYPSPSSSPDLPPTSFPRLSLPTPLETITFATSSLKRKSRPTRSITRPADETDRVELGIVTLDVFTALRTNPSILDVFTASRKDSSPIVKVTKKRKGTPVKEKGKVIEKPKLKKAAETPSRYSKRHEAEKPKTEVSWVYDIELAEEEPEEEEGMEMVRDLEAMGKGEFAREIFQRVKALRKSSAKHVGDESPKTRVKSLAAAAAAVGAKMKKEEEK
ncbi:hypothetical protein BC829DRAFT_214347 [Chytridium lagenaria]|nr:hypothetical protein BC829DRAFT_214347 [Chytridium lagenaria]